jgi:Saxitoxin biosynthesis operon protein SxtJ
LRDVKKGPKNPERSFGISVGGVLCGIAVLLLWRGRITGGEVVGSIGAVLLIAGLIQPALLRYPSAAWWRLARALGYVNARLLLTVLYAFVLVPLSMLWRVTGRDPLMRRRGTWPGWSRYPARYRDRRHYERMY